MKKIVFFFMMLFFTLAASAETIDGARKLPTAFTEDELTPEQKSYFEENYITTGAFHIDLSGEKVEIKKRPPNAQELVDAADKLFKKGYIQEALAQAQEAIRQDKDYLPAYRVMADILQESGSPEQSLPFYDKILEKTPDADEVYMNRGYAYGRLNQFDLAIADYNKALELNPNAANAISARASAYVRTGNIDLAKKDYKRLKEFDEEQAYFGLGNVAAADSSWEEALAYYDKTSAVSPNFAPAYFMKGQILLELGRKEEASDSLKKAKALGMTIPSNLEQIIQ